MAQQSSQDRLFEIKRKKEKRKRGLIVLGVLCGVLCLLFIPTQLKIWQMERQLNDYQQQEQELLARPKVSEIRGKETSVFPAPHAAQTRNVPPAFPSLPNSIRAATALSCGAVKRSSPNNEE